MFGSKFFYGVDAGMIYILEICTCLASIYFVYFLGLFKFQVKKCLTISISVLSSIIIFFIPRSFPALVLYLTVVILTLIGTLLVIIPGVLFCIFTAFYLQVFTLDNNGIIDSIGNSISFSEGFRGCIFKMSIIEIIIYLINDYTILWLLTHLFNSTISSGVGIIISSVITSIMTIGYTSLYLKIREIKTIE